MKAFLLAGFFALSAHAAQTPSSLALPKASTKSDLVEMTIAPAIPIVINGDFNVGTQVIRAPWFEYQVLVTNNSDEPVTIIGLQTNVAVPTKSGAPIVKQTTITPSDYNYSYKCADGSSMEITFSDFGEIPAKTTKNLYLTYRGPLSPGCLAPDINPANIYVGGNPIADTNSFDYSVQMTPQGWFGTYNEPKDRFEKTIYFKAQ
jgi:hypothetical protein